MYSDANTTTKFDYVLRAAGIYPGINTTKCGYALQAASMYSDVNTTTIFDYALPVASMYSRANTTTKCVYKCLLVCNKKHLGSPGTFSR